MATTTGWKRAFLAGLDYVLDCVERVVVIAVAVTIIVALVYGVLGGETLGELIACADKHWKAAALLLVPLLYRTIRSYLERVVKAPGGLEARSHEHGDAPLPDKH